MFAPRPARLNRRRLNEHRIGKTAFSNRLANKFLTVHQGMHTGNFTLVAAKLKRRKNPAEALGAVELSTAQRSPSKGTHKSNC